MRYTVWFGESEAAARYVIEIAKLGPLKPATQQIWAGKDFVRNPVALQQILYLDRPDVIITQGEPELPILAVEFCAEAPTGHNIPQRLARVAAAAEFGTPFAFVFPRRKFIPRQVGGRWDEYNPLPFRVLAEICRFHSAPVAAFFWEADEKKGRPDQRRLLCDRKHRAAVLPDRATQEMKAFAQFIQLAIQGAVYHRSPAEMALDPVYTQRLVAMQQAYWARTQDGNRAWSPLTDADTIETSSLAEYVSDHAGVQIQLPDHVRGRASTLVYRPETTQFRSDPYAGCLVALDYHECRNGPTTRHRHRNLVLHLPRVPIKAAAEKFERYHQHTCPMRPGGHGRAERFLTLHLRDGCRYTKQKELRVFCHLADLVVFKDAVLF